MSTVIYSRINQSSASNAHQTSELLDFAKSKGLVVAKYFEEVSDGANTLEERPVLKDLIAYARENKIKNVIIHSRDRLSRDNDFISQIVGIFDSINIVLHVKSE
jgi:DNA invertase Pin-like site-specific DNA recombinase